MNKSFRIIPTNTNSSGQYQVTLYYSQAEVNGWQSATGQTFNNIQMIKLPGQISSVTPANPHPDGPATVDVVIPTRTAFGNDYALTYTFSNGFSGFGAGVAGAALPVGLLDFTGRLKNNSSLLNWKTGFELNSKGFDIERSYDGQTFSKIGYVSAAGNSNLTLNYTFTDKMIAQENNYYRLRQIDLDNRYEYSRVVLIKNPQTDKNPFRVLRNPFSNTIDIQFGRAPNGPVQAKLMDMSGRVMLNWSSSNVSLTRIRIDAGEKLLSQAIYLLQVNVDGKVYVERVKKE
jgi:hypothetical protein